MTLRNAPPIGCGRRFLITLNGEPFAGFDEERQARDVLDMYQDRKDNSKYRFELRTQTPQDHLDPCKAGAR